MSVDSLPCFDSREFVFSEKFPFAFVLLPHERCPRLGHRVETELVGKGTVLVIKCEFDPASFIVDLAITKSREFSSEVVDPMTNVALITRVVSDEDHRFVFRWRRNVTIVQFDELVVEHPLGVQRVLCNAAAAEFSLDTPIANEIIKQGVLKLGTFGAQNYGG
jgi:hypothetical protein